MKQITINHNFYFSAGGKYKWEKTHDRRGVGIRFDTLKENKEVELVIAGRKYHLNCGDAIEFIKQFQSIETHKGIRIGIVSKSVLNEVEIPTNESNPQVYSPNEEKERLQPRLL